MKFRHNNLDKAQSGFTMVEIALSLAVIGIALVAIIGVLPIGMNVQKDNREETIVDQDATIFIQAIRNGMSSPYATDLTNYVYAITNFQTPFNNGGAEATTPTLNGYNNTYLTNNARIIGLLSWPEYTDKYGNPIPYLSYANPSYSNHVVAYVHSISGAAVEKPPQDNPLIQQDSFGYEMICGNVPVAVDTNSLTLDTNSYNYSTYSQQLTANLHELRLTFLWPLLPSGNTGPGRQTFRSMVGGQITISNDTSMTPNQLLYFLQSQSFTNVPVQ